MLWKLFPYSIPNNGFTVSVGFTEGMDFCILNYVQVLHKVLPYKHKANNAWDIWDWKKPQADLSQKLDNILNKVFPLFFPSQHLMLLEWARFA